MDEFTALRERRNSMERADKGQSNEEGCGSPGDLDMCETNKHDCHQNATCNSDMNNGGYSYNCTCNPGFFGDGKNCDGKLIGKLSLISLHNFPSVFCRAYCSNHQTY